MQRVFIRYNTKATSDEDRWRVQPEGEAERLVSKVSMNCLVTTESRLIETGETKYEVVAHAMQINHRREANEIILL